MAAAADLLHDKMHLFSACLTIINNYLDLRNRMGRLQAACKCNSRRRLLQIRNHRHNFVFVRFFGDLAAVVFNQL